MRIEETSQGDNFQSIVGQGISPSRFFDQPYETYLVQETIEAVADVAPKRCHSREKSQESSYLPDINK